MSGRRLRGGRSGMGSGLCFGDEGEGELGSVPRLPHPARPLGRFPRGGQRRRRGRECGWVCAATSSSCGSRRRSVDWWTRRPVLGCACSDAVSAQETLVRGLAGLSEILGCFVCPFYKIFWFCINKMYHMLNYIIQLFILVLDVFCTNALQLIGSFYYTSSVPKYSCFYPTFFPSIFIPTTMNIDIYVNYIHMLHNVYLVSLKRIIF
jgi:hypothetical protein